MQWKETPSGHIRGHLTDAKDKQEASKNFYFIPELEIIYNYARDYLKKENKNVTGAGYPK